MYDRILRTIIMNSGKLDHQEHKIGVPFFSLQRHEKRKQDYKIVQIIVIKAL